MTTVCVDALDEAVLFDLDCEDSLVYFLRDDRTLDKNFPANLSPKRVPRVVALSMIIRLGPNVPEFSCGDCFC